MGTEIWKTYCQWRDRSAFKLGIAFALVLLIVLGSERLRAQESKQVELPSGRLGEMIRLGEAIVAKTTTHPLSKAYVGNALNCTSCHLQNGTHSKAGTFIGE